MNPEIVAEWFRRQSYRVVRTPSSWWYEASPLVYQAFPFHWVIQPEQGELLELMQRQHAIALRYSTPLQEPIGRVSYHVVCDDAQYCLEKLDRRARNAVRNGLGSCRVERVPLERLAEEGWELEADTCRRQGRNVPLSRERWRRRHLAAANLSGFEGWGALVNGRLAASLLCVRIDDWCEVFAQQCLTEFLAARVNNALTFVFTRSTLQRPEIGAVFYTVQSLDAPASVDQFKFRMGYSARPLRQRVMFRPWAAHLVGPWAHRLVSGTLRLNPASGALAKAEGMIRFYLDGKHPAPDQDWPTCLEKPRRESAERVAAKEAPQP